VSYAKVTLIGNLGRDPELRYTPQGNPVTSFTMATSDKRKGRNGELEEKTTWWKVTLWNKMAENASQYLAKGRPVYIEGRPDFEEWQDKEGRARFTPTVTATEMKFLGKSDGQGSGSGERQQSRPSEPAAPASGLELDDEDIPF
jgi:single-strand DNA-binding protein